MKKRIILGMYAALLLGPIVAGIGVYEYIQAKHLLSQGVIVEGKVISQRLNHGRNQAITYVLDVEYSGASIDYEKEFDVPKVTYDAHSPGSSIRVRYLPSDPTVSIIGDSISARTEKIAVGLGVFIFGTILFAWRRNQLKKLH